MSPESFHILATFLRIGIILLLIWLISHLAACANLDRYDRSYSVSYEGAKATVTLRPRDLPQNQDIPPAFR
jgi:hypothetical protein